MEKNLTFILGITSVVVSVSMFGLKYIFDFLFKDETILKPKANQLFFIPSFKHIRKIIFQKITDDNYIKIKESISAVYALLLVSNTRYYVPERLSELLEQLYNKFDESLDKTTDKPISTKDVNKLFQKFCNIYFLNYNQYKNSPFSLSYNINSNHKMRIFLLRIKYFYRYLLYMFSIFVGSIGIILISITIIVIIIQIIIKMFPNVK